MTKEKLQKRHAYIRSLTGQVEEETSAVHPDRPDTLPQTDGPKILVFDIETAPIDAWIWSLWNEVRTTDFISSEWYALSWSAKWLGETETITRTLIDYEGYKEDPKDDKDLMKDLWYLLDECDLAIAHNGKKFDRRKVNARFIMNGFPPPSPYKVVDTLLEARKNFMFTSNRLGDLGVYLGVGTKEETGGFELWKRCISGDLEAWSTMRRYNERDITLLEDVYIALRPYMTSHPNIGVYQSECQKACAKCGSHDIELVEGKTTPTSVSQFQMYKCNNCGAFSRGRKNVLSKEKRDELLTGISGQ